MHIYTVHGVIRMTKVFVDGSAGTTGLKIVNRLEARDDIELIRLPDEYRKDAAARSDAINSSDIVFLCLPDAAAIESAEMVNNPHTVVIDTSTAHRTDDNWTYGFPEIGCLKEKIKNSKYISNPGCHASGFISLIAPLAANGLISKEVKLTCFSVTGYSGGGKKMIADYEGDEKEKLTAPRMYGLTQNHKHLGEMKKICSLSHDPVFSPIVSSYYSGMEVTVPLFADQLNVSVEELKQFYKEYYKGPVVTYNDNPDPDGFASAGSLSGLDSMQISVFGNDERITLVSRFDNLGKGASGAAIQNMNIVLGVDETTGLNIGG